MKSKARKSRKRKFLSLRHQLAAESSAADDRKPAMNLFPLQPEDKDHDNSVADRFFAAADGGAATLVGILPAADGGSPETNAAASPSSASMLLSVPSSAVRTALRSREREEEKEEIRWVRMSEVVGERRAEEEVSSRAAEAEGEEMWWLARRRVVGGGGLSLKLDYKEVVDAWCGKGRPFWRGQGAQTVPDLQLQDDFLCDDLNAANGGLWRVPEQKSCGGNGGEATEGWKVGQREASVLRYKEKRMNRLFSKRIRYQVRKLNAEKRPRVKGRFVKRS